MAITAQQVITLARKLLFDADGTQWDDASLLSYLCEAQRDLLKKRPDLLLTDTMVVASIVDPALVSSALIVDGNYRLPLAEIVVSMALSEDNADKSNEAKAGDFKKSSDIRTLQA